MGDPTYNAAFAGAGAGLGLLASCLLGGPLGCLAGLAAGAALGSQVGGIAYQMDHPEATGSTASSASASTVNPIYEMQNAMYTIISLQLTMQMMQTMMQSLNGQNRTYTQIMNLIYPILIVSIISSI